MLKVKEKPLPPIPDVFEPGAFILFLSFIFVFFFDFTLLSNVF